MNEGTVRSSKRDVWSSGNVLNLYYVGTGFESRLSYVLYRDWDVCGPFL